VCPKATLWPSSSSKCRSVSRLDLMAPITYRGSSQPLVPLVYPAHLAKDHQCRFTRRSRYQGRPGP
jgi:hypothetical protein